MYQRPLKNICIGIFGEIAHSKTGAGNIHMEYCSAKKCQKVKSVRKKTKQNHNDGFVVLKGHRSQLKELPLTTAGTI